MLLLATVLTAVVAAASGRISTSATTIVNEVKQSITASVASSRRRPGAAGRLRDWPRALQAIRATRPIAVFDSGVGGLTVLHELLVSLPHEDFLYLGDTARFPYGERRAAELERFRLEIAERAAGPAGEAAGRRLQLGDGGGAARAAAAHDGDDARRRRARRRPARGGAGRRGDAQRPDRAAGDAGDRRPAARTPRRSRRRPARRRWRPSPAPTSRRSSRAGSRSTSGSSRPCAATAAPLREADVDTVILGCTHYPLVRRCCSGCSGRGVKLVTSGAALARQVEHALARRGLAQPGAASEGDYRSLHGRPRVLPRARHEVPADAAGRCRARRARRRGPRRDATPAALLRPRPRRPAPDDDRARLRPHRDRLGADLDRRDAGDLHRVGAGARAALDGRQGPRLGHRRVRDAARVDGPAQAARRHARAARTAARSRSSG